MPIIIFIILLSILVLFHELGHFLAAKWAGVKVLEFGLGYPPRAMKLFTWRGTEFTLNWIPFGGFVQMAGENGPEEENSENKKTTKSNDVFYEKPAYKRMVVILAGVVFNFILGIVAFTTVFAFTGVPTPIDTPRIGFVADGSPAQESNLQIDTEITGFRVEDQFTTTNTRQDVVDFTKEHLGETVTLVTTGQCQGLACPEIAQEHQVYLRTTEETPDGEGALGIAFADHAAVFYPWYQMPFRASWYGLQQAFFLSLLIIQALSQMVVDLGSGIVPADVAGPVGIVHQAAENHLFEQGPLVTLNFLGMLSINLGIMNLLPIPALDGGRAVFIVVEKIFGKKKSQTWEGYANSIGYIFLVGLIILVTFKDIGSIIL